MNFLALSPYVFGTSLTWYSLCVLCGALLTYIISNYFYKKDPESKKCPDLILNLLLIGFPSGLLGARIWFIFSEWDYYSSSPIEMLKVWEGGLAIQGGVMVGAAVGIYYAIHKMRKCGMSLKITTLTDMIIPNILIAQVIGRWGNFFNREVYGACVDSDTLWFLPSFIKDYMRGGTVAGQYIACPTSQYAQPLFLYEGILNLIGFILITIVLRKILKGKYSGVLTSLYLVWYGTVRVSLEGLRNEMFIMRWGNISQSILTSIVFIVVGVALLVYFYIRGYKENKTLVNLSDTSNDTTNNIEISNEESEDILVKEDTKKTPIKKSVTNKLKTDSKTKTTRKATSKSSKKTSKEEL